jgi:hypothetical protein
LVFSFFLFSFFLSVLFQQAWIEQFSALRGLFFLLSGCENGLHGGHSVWLDHSSQVEIVVA